MKRLLFTLLVSLLVVQPAYALSTFITAQGGTGTSSPSGLLYGDNGATSHLNTVVVGSGCSFVAPTLSCSGTGITALGNYATTTGAQISFSTSTLIFNGLTLGNTFVVSPNAILITPTVTGTLNNAGLTNSSITINGTVFNLGDTHTITAASSTLLSDNNTFNGTDVFSKLLNLSATTSALLSTDSSGNVIATSSVGTNYITGVLGTINGTSFSRGGTITISAASSTLLGDNNTFTGRDAFALIRLTATSSSLLSTDSGGNIIATTSIGTNLLTSNSITISSPNSTLSFTNCGPVALGGTCSADFNLAHGNTWTALQQFQGGASTTQLSVYTTAYVGGSATSSIQGNTTGTSTLQGFLNVLGTNSTSTFSGGVAATYLNLTSSSASSTFNNGVSISNGCYAVSGTCLTGGIVNTPFSITANYATVVALPNNTYLNGTSGVGATITEVGTGALSVDGSSPAVGQTVLVKNEGTASHNGIYDVTAAGSGIAAFVLTRDINYDQPNEVIPGIITYVLSGTTNNDSFWAMTSAAPITIGTTALNYTEVSGGGSNVSSVSNSDGTLTISPTTGAVVASIALAHADTWTGLQQFNGQASSTQFSCYGPCYFGGTSTSSFSSTGALNLANPLTVSNGGTNNNSFSANGLVIYSSGAQQLANFSNYTLTSTLLTAPNASTTNFSAVSTWLTGPAASSLLALDQNNKVIATSSVGTNLLYGDSPTQSILTVNGSNQVVASSTIGESFLQNSGVAAGSYTSTNITVNAQGFVTAASNGSGGSVSGGTAGMLTSWVNATTLTATGTPTATAYFATTTNAISEFAGSHFVGTTTIANCADTVLCATATTSVSLAAANNIFNVASSTGASLFSVNGNGLTTLQNATTTLATCTGPCYFGSSAVSNFSTGGALTIAGTADPAIDVEQVSGNFPTIRVGNDGAGGGTTLGDFFADPNANQVFIGSHTASQFSFRMNNATEGYFDTSNQFNLQESSGAKTIMQISAPSGNSQEATISGHLNLGSANDSFYDMTIENYGTDNQVSLNSVATGTNPILPLSFRFWNDGPVPIASAGVYAASFLPTGQNCIEVSTSTCGYATSTVLYDASSTATNLLALDALPGTRRFTVTGLGDVTIGTTSSLIATDKGGNLIASSSVGTNLLYAPANSLLAGNAANSVIASSTIGTNLLESGTTYALLASNGTAGAANVVASSTIGWNLLASIGSITPTQTGLWAFNGGLTAYATSTHGNGTQIGGLTISGGATTTLNAYFAADIAVSTSTNNTFAQVDIGMAATTPAFAVWGASSSTPAFYIGTLNQNGNIGLSTTTPQTGLSLGNGVAISTYEASTSPSKSGTGWNCGATTCSINPMLSNSFKIEPTGNTTVDIASASTTIGQTWRVTVCQDSTGSRLITWNSSTSIVWSGGGTAPTLSTAAGTCDVVSFLTSSATGTLDVFGSSVLNFP